MSSVQAPSTDGTYPTTPRTTLKRLAARGRYDRAAVHAVLDEALVCHVGFVHEGSPVVIPIAYCRIGDAVYLHGSSGNRMLRSVASGAPACLTFTLIDGLVLARTSFHHSVNYRSVVMFGSGERVTDAAEHLRALEATVEHVVPGRSGLLRPSTREELLQTLVVRFPIVEVSLKERMGGPIDDEADHDPDLWAGHIPLRLVPGAPVDDPLVPPRVPPPDHARNYRRPGRAD